MAEQDSNPSLEMRTAASSGRKVSNTPEHLVRWEQVAKAAETFCYRRRRSLCSAPSSNGSTRTPDVPHRLLEQLNVHVNGVLSGDSTASAELAHRLSTFAESDPCLIGSLDVFRRNLNASAGIGGRGRTE